MTNDAFTRWDGVPFSDDVVLTVMLRSGKTITSKACDLDWSGDIVAYKILEKITPEDFVAVADQKGHPNAGILMEIAKEAAVNEEYWKEFEVEYTDFNNKQKWERLYESGLLTGIYEGRKIRRKPRTIRIGKYDVPEPSEISIKHFDNSSSVLIDFDNVENARSMLKALQELLCKK